MPCDDPVLAAALIRQIYLVAVLRVDAVGAPSTESQQVGPAPGELRPVAWLASRVGLQRRAGT